MTITGQGGMEDAIVATDAQGRKLLNPRPRSGKPEPKAGEAETEPRVEEAEPENVESESR